MYSRWANNRTTTASRFFPCVQNREFVLKIASESLLNQQERKRIRHRLRLVWACGWGGGWRVGSYCLLCFFIFLWSTLGCIDNAWKVLYWYMMNWLIGLGRLARRLKVDERPQTQINRCRDHGGATAATVSQNGCCTVVLREACKKGGVEKRAWGGYHSLRQSWTDFHMQAKGLQ